MRCGVLSGGHMFLSRATCELNFTHFVITCVAQEFIAVAHMRSTLLLLSVITNFERATSCACITTAWTANGPPASCIALLNAECATNGSLVGLPVCSVPSYVADPLSNAMSWMGVLGAHAMQWEADAAACGVPYFSYAALLRTWTAHPLYWTNKETATFLLMSGEAWMGVSSRSDPNAAKMFWDQDIDGKMFMSATRDDLRNVGLSVGSSVRFVVHRTTWLDSYSWPPSDSMGHGMARVVGNQFNVSVTFMLERLLELHTESFQFEVEMMMIVTWEDPKVFARCTNSGVGGFNPADPCALFWQPKLLWPNLVLGDHPDSTLEPSVIEDFGFSTIVGKQNEQSGAGDKPSQVVNTSVAMRIYRVRGTFMADTLDFRGFPYDRQQLAMTVQLPFTLPLRKARIVSRAEPMPIKPNSGTPIWNVECVTTHEGERDYTGIGTTFNDVSLASLPSRPLAASHVAISYKHRPRPDRCVLAGARRSICGLLPSCLRSATR